MKYHKLCGLKQTNKKNLFLSPFQRLRVQHGSVSRAGPLRGCVGEAIWGRL